MRMIASLLQVKPMRRGRLPMHPRRIQLRTNPGSQAAILLQMSTPLPQHSLFLQLCLGMCERALLPRAKQLQRRRVAAPVLKPLLHWLRHGKQSMRLSWLCRRLPGLPLPSPCSGTRTGTLPLTRWPVR